MAHPTIVIELMENCFEALYSTTELSFIIVNRTADDAEPTISGPHTPTLEKSELAHVIDGVEIPRTLLTATADQPFFVSKETSL